MARSILYHSLLPALLLGAWIVAIGPSAAASPETPKPDDPRLSRSLTLDLVQVPLSDLCQVMARRSGVAHRAADAPAGDLRADVVGTLTVAQLQQALAVVLGVTWKREGEGDAAAYVASQPPAKLMEAAREQAAADRTYGEGLQRLRAAANLPDSARGQLPRELSSRLSEPRQRAMLQLLGDLTPEEQARALAGAGVERAVASLSPAGQARVKAIVEDLERKFNEIADESLADPPPPGTPRPIRRAQPLNLEDGQPWRVRITRPMEQSTRGSMLYMVTISSPKEPGIGTGISVLIAPPGNEDSARYRLSVPEAGRLPSRAPAAPNSEPSGTGGAGNSNSSPPQLPERFEPQGTNWEEIVRDLARRLDCPVVSDAYRPSEWIQGGIGPAEKEDTLNSYLDRACRFAFGRRWGRLGPVLLLQRCDWATQRRAQIPESLARRWKQPIIDTGRLALNHLIEMAALSPYQLPNLGAMMGREADRVMEHQALLLLWKALPPARRAALRREGLAIRDLPLATQSPTRTLVNELLGTSAPLALSNAKLRIEQTEEAFTLSVLSPDRPTVTRRIDLACPPGWQERLRNEAETRAAALRAAGVAAPDGPPAAPDSRGLTRARL